MKPSCVLFGARPVPAPLLRYVPPGAIVAAADAGWRTALALGLVPQLVVGDFDSSPPPGDALSPETEVVVLPPAKDDTDTQFAARELVKLGCGEVVLLGMLGGRWDHALAAMATLLWLARAGCRPLLADETAEIRCVLPGEPLRLPRQPGRYLSVFPAAGTARGVCERGVAFPLDDAVLEPWMPLGVSNEWAAETAEIRCGEGALFVMTVERHAP